jgi:hypothetical protein
MWSEYCPTVKKILPNWPSLPNNLEVGPAPPLPSPTLYAYVYTIIIIMYYYSLTGKFVRWTCLVNTNFGIDMVYICLR